MPTNGSSSKKENSRNTVKLKMVRSEGGRQWLVCAFAFLAHFCSGWIHDDWRGFVHKINRRI